jgi:exosortase/archaeosortase family protein
MTDKSKSYIAILANRMKPFKNIVWFLCLFLIFDFIWKICVRPMENESIFFVLGHDLTAYTEGLNRWTADILYWIIHDLLDYQDFRIISETSFSFEDSIPVEIIWGCTGLKQFFMFAFILALYYGPVKKKVWYIPLSLFILFAINILRLVIIVLIIRTPFPEWFISVNEWYNSCTWVNTKECYYKFYKDWFNLFHRDIFVWVYYDGVIFVLWLIWEEKIRKPYDRLMQKKAGNKQNTAE